MLITYISMVTVNFQNGSLQQNSSAVLQVIFFFCHLFICSVSQD